MDRTLSEIASFAHRLRYEDLPATAVDAAKRLTVDAIGCAYGGYDSAPAQVARRIAGNAPVPRGAAVLGSGQRTTPELAAFANGAMVRYLDFNDTYIGPGGAGHPSDYIPAVLAAAEPAQGADGKRIIAGIVVAYEVFCGLTDAASLRADRWDHVTHGVTASAAAAAAVMGLPEEQIAHAISLAAVANVALQETRLGTIAMWKGCAAANACRNGVFAALLAAEGLTGPANPFTGRAGLCAEVAPLSNPLVLGDPAQPLAITNCHIKRYPAGFFSQTAIEAALEVRPRLASPDDIAAVEIETSPLGKQFMAGDEEKWRPATRESADHSLPYLVSAALLYGDVAEQHFDERHLQDVALLDLTRRVAVRVSPECSAAWPKAAMSVVHVTTHRGERQSATVRFHRGHAKNPMTDAEVEAKFRRQVANVLTAAKMDRLLDAMWRLESLGSAAEVLELSRA